MSEQACKTPLVDLLRNVPKDHRSGWPIQWAEDGAETGHAMCPIGRLAHEAADRIAELEAAQAQAQAGDREAFCDANCTWLDHHKDCAVLPVAWMRSEDAARAMIASEGERAEVAPDREDGFDVPLYAAPPAAKVNRQDLIDLLIATRTQSEGVTADLIIKMAGEKPAVNQQLLDDIVNLMIAVNGAIKLGQLHDAVNYIDAAITAAQENKMTPSCITQVDELAKTNYVFANLTVEQLLYAAIKDTDLETVLHVLLTTDWSATAQESS